MLPAFELVTVIPPQTIAGNGDERYGTWFEALAALEREVDRCEFDIAIIGCGAYGFPLAAHIKKMGKQAIHLGGATQMLFGIRGRRWDLKPIGAELYNEWWIRPSAGERPKNAASVEGGCYW